MSKEIGLLCLFCRRGHLIPHEPHLRIHGVPGYACDYCGRVFENPRGSASTQVRKCSHCGDETEEFCIIEKGQPGVNWIEDIWVALGYEGLPVCVECYYK